jgi:hypothetical protein
VVPDCFRRPLGLEGVGRLANIVCIHGDPGPRSLCRRGSGFWELSGEVTLPPHSTSTLVARFLTSGPPLRRTDYRATFAVGGGQDDTLVGVQEIRPDAPRVRPPFGAHIRRPPAPEAVRFKIQNTTRRRLRSPPTSMPGWSLTGSTWSAAAGGGPAPRSAEAAASPALRPRRPAAFAAAELGLVTRLRLQCSEALAEGAAAHAWLQLCRVQPKPSESLPGWLRVVALYEDYNLLRKHTREPLPEDVCRQKREDGRRADAVPIEQLAQDPST